MYFNFKFFVWRVDTKNKTVSVQYTPELEGLTHPVYNSFPLILPEPESAALQYIKNMVDQEFDPVFIDKVIAQSPQGMWEKEYALLDSPLNLEPYEDIEYESTAIDETTYQTAVENTTPSPTLPTLPTWEEIASNKRNQILQSYFSTLSIEGQSFGFLTGREAHSIFMAVLVNSSSTVFTPDVKLVKTILDNAEILDTKEYTDLLDAAYYWLTTEVPVYYGQLLFKLEKLKIATTQEEIDAIDLIFNNSSGEPIELLNISSKPKFPFNRGELF